MPTEFHRAFQREMQNGLRELEKQGQRRTLVDVDGAAGVGASRAVTNLCSNDYLGLSQSEELRAAVVEAVRAVPRVGGTGSRLLSGHSRDWDSLEQEFAEFVGTDAALYFGSGYTANVGLLASVLRKDDVVFSDELNHASLIDGMRLSGARKVIYRHLDLNDLESALRRAAGDGGRRFVVSESVFSMDGDVVDVAALALLCARYDAGLILDEAHATAVHGPEGRGVAASAQLAGEMIADHAYVRQSVGQRRRIYLRERGAAGTFDQSCADFYFQHGDAAVHGGADSRCAAHCAGNERSTGTAF